MRTLALSTPGRSKRVMFHGLFWAGVYLFNVLENWYRSEDKAAILEIQAVQLPLQVAAAYLLAYFQLPRYLFQKKYYSFVGSLVGSAYLISSVYVAYKTFYFKSAHPGYFKPDSKPTALLFLDGMTYLMYAVMFYTPAVVLSAIHLVRIRAHEAQKIQLLEKEKLQTELSFLKNQLNPHFLFNTLNNLYMLTLKASPLAPEVVAKLSETLDYMLYRCQEKEVPVKGEIALIENYLLLEKLRLSKDADVTFSVQGTEVREQKVAPLIMLSLVENAFKHGVSNSLENPAVNIQLEITDGMLVLVVANTRGVPSVSGPHGIGLRNIRRQLELIYHEKYTLNIDDQQPGRYTVTLKITFPR